MSREFSQFYQPLSNHRKLKTFPGDSDIVSFSINYLTKRYYLRIIENKALTEYLTQDTRTRTPWHAPVFIITILAYDILKKVFKSTAPAFDIVLPANTVETTFCTVGGFTFT